MISSHAPFLTARWVHLVMLNYEVDPTVLADRVPAGTELDGFGGKTHVSMVGFQFLETRVFGVSIPFHRHFDEVNLRFYVRREAHGSVRRGVVFIKEIVPRRIIAWIARGVYNENYVARAMRHVDEIGVTPRPRLSYEWDDHKHAYGLTATVTGSPYLPAPDSEETFITEHYWGYVRQRDGETLEYQVEHPQWQVWGCSDARLECDVEETYGPEFAPYLTGTPLSAFVAEGSRVAVYRGRRLRS